MNDPVEENNLRNFYINVKKSFGQCLKILLCQHILRQMISYRKFIWGLFNKQTIAHSNNSNPIQNVHLKMQLHNPRPERCKKSPASNKSSRILFKIRGNTL